MTSTRRRDDTDLREAEWALLAPLLPPEQPGGRPRENDLRELLHGIRYVLRTGAAWRPVQVRLGERVDFVPFGSRGEAVAHAQALLCAYGPALEIILGSPWGITEALPSGAPEPITGFDLLGGREGVLQTSRKPAALVRKRHLTCSTIDSVRFARRTEPFFRESKIRIQLTGALRRLSH